VTSGAAMVKCSILELKSAASWAPAGFQNSVLALSCGFGLPVGPQVTASGRLLETLQAVGHQLGLHRVEDAD
jgi:hypothetical protein